MKKIISEYKELIEYFLMNKKYSITVILVAILSYGFTITHYSVGIDDLCFDRYVYGTYMLSQKRWGTWGLYNILQINEFSPFWLDTITMIFIIVIAIVLCTFIKKQYGEKIKIWGYILFSSLLISNPLINQFFIYQSTNLAVVVSNLIVIICGIFIFENYFNENKKWINIISGLILTIPIAMYESCAQTYLVFLFVTMLVKTTQDKVESKKIFKYFCLSIMMLILGTALYFVIGKILIFILNQFNILNTNFAATDSIWLDETFKSFSVMEKLNIIKKLVVQKISINTHYLPVITFWMFSLITIVLEFVKVKKENKAIRILCIFGMIISNFILIIILLYVFYRMQFSWIITTAFLGLYIYQNLCERKIFKYPIRIVAVLLIVIQTRMLNQYFYNDYKRYEQEKVIANDIAINVMKNCDYKNKPLLCILTEERGNKYRINKDNGASVLVWGIDAFNEFQTEITKFINDQGYRFLYITEEEAYEGYRKYKQLDEDTKSKEIIELEDVIIVTLDSYDF